MERTGYARKSFTANAPLKVDSATVRDLAWRRAKARAVAKLTNLISVDLAARCSGGEKGAITETFSNGEEVFTAEDSFEELCDYVRDAERTGRLEINLYKDAECAGDHELMHSKLNTKKFPVQDQETQETFLGMLK